MLLLKKVMFINDMPFSLGFGGKEVQLLKYQLFLKDSYDVKFLDPWEKIDLHDFDTFHLFGCGKYFHNLIGQIQQKSPHSRIILSPTIYYENFRKVKFGNFLSNLVPLKTQFDYKSYIFENADIILANSSAEKDFLCYVWGDKLNDKIKVIYNSIDTSIRTRWLASDLDLPTNRNFILSVGFQDERKNSLRMLKAFYDTIQEHDLDLVLAGGPRFVDLKNRDVFDKLIMQLGNRVHLTGFLAPNSLQLLKLYEHCAFHLLPSFVETPGLANLEALAFGKDIIVGSCRPTREYFDGIAHFCNPVSTRSISNEILKLAKRKSDFNEKNYEFVQGNFSDEVLKKQLLGIYE